ncbi:3'(2'),5'-bisphosphate nucleotidase CysQ [Bacteroidota bacterium]
MNNSFKMHLMTAIGAAMAAGDAILKVYNKPDYTKELKADHSPVTEADYAAQAVISDHLQVAGFPVLSEEGGDIKYEDRKNWETFWLVDPLDGTKEFIRRNGEFTVNIALIHGIQPVLGILYAPLPDLMYFSDVLEGGFRIESFSQKWPGIISLEDLLQASETLPLNRKDRPFRVVASRSHRNRHTNQYIRKLKKIHPGLELVSRGSALKLCLVAEGSADIYPRFAPTWEWDTGAGQAIAEASGCKVTHHDTESPIIYNKEILLNPWFIVRRP